MNDLLKQRIARLLDSLSDERGYEILDYIEFLDSKYAERARPGGIFARLTETVEDTMRAGRLPIQAIERNDGDHGQRGQGHERTRGCGSGGGGRGRYERPKDSSTPSPEAQKTHRYFNTSPECRQLNPPTVYGVCRNLSEFSRECPGGPRNNDGHHEGEDHRDRLDSIRVDRRERSRSPTLGYLTRLELQDLSIIPDQERTEGIDRNKVRCVIIHD